MHIVFLLLLVSGMAITNATKKTYNSRSGGKGSFTFNTVFTLAAMTFFVVTAKHPLDFSLRLVPYSLAFALSYGSTIMFLFKAIQCGPLPLTSLASSYSLVIPTLYALVFLKEPASASLFIGIAFLLISLFLINARKSDTPISLQWIIYAFLAFLGNGICSTVQKIQQMHFEGGNKNEFMIMALIVVFLFLLIISLIKEKEVMVPCLKVGWYWMIFCGAANGMINFFSMTLVNMMPASVLYPLISAGGIITNSLVSRFIYKEKMSRQQYIGVLMGIISVVFLNL